MKVITANQCKYANCLVFSIPIHFFFFALCTYDWLCRKLNKTFNECNVGIHTLVVDQQAYTKSVPSFVWYNATELNLYFGVQLINVDWKAEDEFSFVTLHYYCSHAINSS